MTRNPIFSSRARTGDVAGVRVPKSRLGYRLHRLRVALRRLLPFGSKQDVDPDPTIHIRMR